MEQQEQGIWTFDIYYEEADGDDPARYLGTITANSGAEALQKASEYWEVPSYDLIWRNQRRTS
jgi:hypothetical protein